MFQKAFQTVMPVAVDDFDAQLEIFKAKMAACVFESLTDVLHPFPVLRLMDSTYDHNYLSVVFDS